MYLPKLKSRKQKFTVKYPMDKENIPLKKAKIQQLHPSTDGSNIKEMMNRQSLCRTSETVKRQHDEDDGVRERGFLAGGLIEKSGDKLLIPVLKPDAPVPNLNLSNSLRTKIGIEDLTPPGKLGKRTPRGKMPASAARAKRSTMEDHIQELHRKMQNMKAADAFCNMTRVKLDSRFSSEHSQQPLSTAARSIRDVTTAHPALAKLVPLRESIGGGLFTEDEEPQFLSNSRVEKPRPNKWSQYIDHKSPRDFNDQSSWDNIEPLSFSQKYSHSTDFSKCNPLSKGLQAPCNNISDDMDPSMEIEDMCHSDSITQFADCKERENYEEQVDYWNTHFENKRLRKPNFPQPQTPPVFNSSYTKSDDFINTSQCSDKSLVDITHDPPHLNNTLETFFKRPRFDTDSCNNEEEHLEDSEIAYKKPHYTWSQPSATVQVQKRVRISITESRTTLIPPDCGVEMAVDETEHCASNEAQASQHELPETPTIQRQPDVLWSTIGFSKSRSCATPTLQKSLNGNICSPTFTRPHDPTVLTTPCLTSTPTIDKEPRFFTSEQENPHSLEETAKSPMTVDNCSPPHCRAAFRPALSPITETSLELKLSQHNVTVED